MNAHRRFKGAAIILAGAMFLTMCTPEPDYGALFREDVKNLSSEEFCGRSVYGNGDIKAARYIIDRLCGIDGIVPLGTHGIGQEAVAVFPPYKSALSPAGEGRWAETEGADKYLPFLQHFQFPMNVMRGDMAVSVDGRELRPTYDFTAKEFSPSCHGEFKLAYMPDSLVTEELFVKWLDEGGFEESFVVVSWPAYKELPAHPFERYLPYLGKLQHVAGIILKDKELFPYFKARSYYTTNMPVLMVTEEFPEGASTIKVDIDAEMLATRDAHNVIAWLPGTGEGDGYCTFIAHYDHLGLMGRDNLYLGANDNASGAAMLLDLARWFSSHRPQTSIQFIFLDAEETNLLGAYYYCGNPRLDLAKCKYLINVDMVADDSDHLATEITPSGEAGLERFREVNASGDFPPFDLALQENTDNSDHYAFGEYGVPAIYFSTEGSILQHYHSPRDSYGNTRYENFDRLFNLLTKFVE